MAESCPYCGLIHGATCPRVRAIEYYPNGAVKKVFLHPEQVFTSGQQWTVNIGNTDEQT